MNLIDQERPEQEPLPIDREDLSTESAYVAMALVHAAVRAEKLRRGGEHLTSCEIINIDRQVTKQTTPSTTPQSS